MSIKLRKQSSTSYPINFFMVQSADHITPATGVSPTVVISKNGAAFAAADGAVTELAHGWYSLAGDADDRDTVGELLIHATATACDETPDKYVIVPWDPFDTVRLGLTALPNAAAEASGGLYTRGTGPGQLGQSSNGLVNVNVSRTYNYTILNKLVTVVDDAGNSASTFKTDLTEGTNDHWSRTLFVFVTGDLAGQVSKVPYPSGYNGTTKFLTVIEPYTAEPTAGDLGLLINI